MSEKPTAGTEESFSTMTTTTNTGTRFASSLSRRAVLGTGAGLATGAALASGRFAFAQQDATPGATLEATPGVPLEATPAAAGPTPDAQMQEVLDALASFEAPPIEDVTPHIARNLPSFANALQTVAAEKGVPTGEPVAGIDHFLIPSNEGEVLARIYRPAGVEADALPVLVYFHGGGFVIANLDTYDPSCRALANATGCIVASIAYRQAPEHPFPAPVDDAYAATQFMLTNAGDIGGDPARVAVAGESVGGNLAAVVSLRAWDEGAPLPVHQILIYPVTTFAPEGDAAVSVAQYKDAKPLNAPMLEWFGSHYLPDRDLASDPLVSPLNADDLSGLPPATVILAEIDPLQSQGVAFAQRLEEAGVDTAFTLYQGVTHEFFGMGAVVDKADEAVAEAAARLKVAFGL